MQIDTYCSIYIGKKRQINEKYDKKGNFKDKWKDKEIIYKIEIEKMKTGVKEKYLLHEIIQY